MKKTAEIFLNMLYPKKCPMCHQILKQKNSLICSGCAGKIRPNVEPLCKKCGRPVKTEEEYCQDCRREQHYFSEGRSIFSYGEMWRQSLVRFKYYGCREYGDFYAKALHPRKKRNRGFNQAAYLAERLSGFCGIPWREDVVRKVRNTRSQKKLNAAKRRQNLKNAYQVTADITGLSVLVVDDVYTTGSTMDAMAQCLLEAGAKEVYFLTVCAGRA